MNEQCSLIGGGEEGRRGEEGPSCFIDPIAKTAKKFTQDGKQTDTALTSAS